MKRFLGIVGVAMAVAVFAIPASASGSNGAGHPFKATYSLGGVGLPGGTATCSGSHVVNKAHVPFDSETCDLSGVLTGLVAGTYGSNAGQPYGYYPLCGLTCYWYSDYYPTTTYASSWTIVLTANGNGGFTQQILAYYAGQTS